MHVDVVGGGGLGRGFAGHSRGIVVIRRSRCSVVLFFLPLVVVVSFVRFSVVDFPCHVVLGWLFALVFGAVVVVLCLPWPSRHLFLWKLR